MKGFCRKNEALVWAQNNEIIQIEAWGPDSLRVRATTSGEILDDQPGGLGESCPEQEVKIEIGEDYGLIRNGAIAAEIRAKEDVVSNAPISAAIRFLNAENNTEALSESPSYFPRPPARYYKAIGGEHYHIEARFKAYDDERIYGLGQHQHGQLNQKGSVIDLLQRNSEVCIPFLLSSRGYGFLWNNPAVGRVELDHDRTRWVAESSKQMDYWVTIGKTPSEILEHYVDVTGHAPILPEWAAGFWQCKLRYRSQEELLSVAREYKRRGLPLSVIVIDFFHWTMQGDWRFDPKHWPDPAAMVRELESMGIKAMVSIWPTVNAQSANFQEMQQRGLLLQTARGVPAHLPLIDNPSEGLVYVHHYDPTNPEARRFIWEQVREGYYQHGIKIWWLDACEPEISPLDADNLRYYLGDGLAVTNISPMMHARAFYEGMRSQGEEEIISLCRSAWAGSQRYGAAVWSGDILSTFEALRAQVPAGLNIGLSGIPWWTTDIGGFLNGDPASPEFRELIVRWFQYGVFCPLFRIHGFRLPRTSGTADGVTGGPNEVWSFGEEAYRIIGELLFLRERLRPYIMEQMRKAHEAGHPPMRPLFFDFPEDSNSYSVEDQFMFGPHLLVAPILHYGARSRMVYLPVNASWTDAWTNKGIDGGKWIEVEAPLDRIPLYLREGANIPIRVG